MKNALREYFPEGLTPFLEGASFDRFLKELSKVPNSKEAFKKLLVEDPLWLKEAKEHGAYFFLQEIYYKEDEEFEDNMIKLCHFCLGACPTINVITFIKIKF